MTTTARKAFQGLVLKDADKGEVEADVCTTGVIDKDGDIIRRGALGGTSPVIMSAWGHDAMYGNRPVGKGTLVEQSGRLRFKGRVFLNTAGGRETFEVLKEMGEDQEWSFGFRVTGWESPSEAEQRAGCYRVITKMDAFEVSPVLVGAGVDTGTTRLKSADDEQRALQQELKAIAARHEQRALQQELKAIVKAHEQRELRAIVKAHEQRELRAIVKAHEQRELRKIYSRIESIERPSADHLVPPELKAHLDDLARYARDYFGLSYLVVKYYERWANEKKVGFFRRAEPNTVYVSVGQRGEEMALTLAHEAAHAGGIRDEAAAEQSAKNMLKAWMAQCRRERSPRLPFSTFDHAA